MNATPRIRAAFVASAPFILVASAAGFALRLWGAEGPLWNDEIWSILNLRSIQHFWQVLWGISHDNNHFLNSLWLYFAEAWGRDSIWLRLPSVIAGALCIPTLAWLGARAGRAGAVAAAILAAGSFFLVAYSVEARGYAVATLALILAFAAMEAAIEAPESAARWRLAAAAGLAFFSHLAAGPALALFGLIALLEFWRRSRNARASLVAALRAFWPSALAMTPTAAFLIAGFVTMGGFTVGHFVAYAPEHAIAAMTGLDMMTFGLDVASRSQTGIAFLLLPALLLLAIFTLALPERRIAYGLMFAGVPLAVVLLHPPNSHPPRYFFALAPFLLLLGAEAFAKLWNMGGPRRVFAVATLAASLVGDAHLFAQLQASKASSWVQALDRIAASADPRLASNYDFNVGKSVAYYNLTHARPVQLAPQGDLCALKPAWFVVEMQNGPTADPEFDVAAGDCRLAYRLNGIFDRHATSQLPWALYELMK